MHLLTIPNPLIMEKKQWTEAKNVAFITLPETRKMEFLDRFGIKVLETYPNINSNSVLRHESGLRARVREIRLIHSKRSARTLVEIKVTNNTCDKALFQSIFYDYLNTHKQLYLEFFTSL